MRHTPVGLHPQRASTLPNTSSSRRTKPAGPEAIRIRLTNVPMFATVDRDAWRSYVARRGGRAPRLFWNDVGKGYGYVRTARSDLAGRTVSLARELMQPGRGVIVRYENDNRLDLRCANLRLDRGHAPGQRPANPDQAVAA